MPMNTHVANLLRTRANMLGTDDEEHYWQCHDAAKEIERLEAAYKVLEDEADMILLVLRELVFAVNEQGIELDPIDRLVRAIRDAQSWIGKSKDK